MRWMRREGGVEGREHEKNCVKRIMCVGMEYEDDDDLMRVC